MTWPRTLLRGFVLVSCLSWAEEPKPKPYDWKTDGSLRQKEADAKCAAEKPACKRAFAVYEAPPNPCANRGARCLEMPKDDGFWVCGCDECLSRSDCKKSEHCGTSAAPCGETRRLPLRCMPGPAPKPVSCPPPPPDPPSRPQ